MQADGPVPRGSPPSRAQRGERIERLRNMGVEPPDGKRVQLHRRAAALPGRLCTDAASRTGRPDEEFSFFVRRMGDARAKVRGLPATTRREAGAASAPNGYAEVGLRGEPVQRDPGCCVGAADGSDSSRPPCGRKTTLRPRDGMRLSEGVRPIDEIRRGTGDGSVAAPAVRPGGVAAKKPRHKADRALPTFGNQRTTSVEPCLWAKKSHIE